MCVLDQRIRETFFFFIVYLAVVRMEGCATVTVLPLFLSGVYTLFWLSFQLLIY